MEYAHHAREIVMLTCVARCLIPATIGAVVALAKVQTDAHSATNGAGLIMKAYYATDAACFSSFNYGAVINTCPTARWLSTSLSVPAGWHSTSVSIFGNNSYCHTATTNNVGMPYSIGPDVGTLTASRDWNSLDTGDRFVYDWSPVVFECLLESNGVIGSFSAL
jgi:hypothetical protein